MVYKRTFSGSMRARGSVGSNNLVIEVGFHNPLNDVHLAVCTMPRYFCPNVDAPVPVHLNPSKSKPARTGKKATEALTWLGRLGRMCRQRRPSTKDFVPSIKARKWLDWRCPVVAGVPSYPVHAGKQGGCPIPRDSRQQGHFQGRISQRFP